MFLREWLTWCWLYLQHTFIMMYWVTLPGLLSVAFLSLRYRAPLLGTMLKRQRGVGAGLSAIGLGLLDGDAGRAARLRTMENLSARGVSPSVALAYLLAGQTFPLPVIGLFTVLLGLEFGLGLLLGGLAMILLAAPGLPLLGLAASRQGEVGRASFTTPSEAAGEWTWARLLGSAGGWGAAVRWVARVFKGLWFPSVAGLVLGGVVLALDMHEVWILPAWLGNEKWETALVSAFLAPLLATVAFVFPLGNLVVASSIWKTWTLAYSGVLSFALAASFHPLTLRTLSARYGLAQTARLGLLLYLAACLGALAVPVLWRIIGLEVTHVPWFRDLVDRIMMGLPFTMLGTGGMPGGRMMSH
ncbi:MAG: hypothetical protein HYZ03_00035 [candidate division NC10 bacterium]|nr:hypothetical protein [candidate division NC10 bacterium]